MTIRQVCGLLVLLLPVWIYIALNARRIPWGEVGRTGLSVVTAFLWIALCAWLLFGGRP